MYFLLGLLGMMAVGSVAVVSTGEEMDDLSTDADRDDSDELEDAPQGAASAQGGQSLFESMGLGDEDDLGDMNAEDAFAQEVQAPMSSAEQPEVDTDPSDEEESHGHGHVHTPIASEQAIAGTDGDDQISIGDGYGAAFAGSGDDVVEGGSNKDTLFGQDGDDLVSGGEGEDDLYGDDGDDTLKGEEGRDVLFGGAGDDQLEGGDDRDALQGGLGQDHLEGGMGRDTLMGQEGDDLIDGTVRDDQGQDQDGKDLMHGGEGDDTLIAGSGDMVFGGEGEDLFVLGDWISGSSSELVDFSSNEDQLVVIYDDADNAEEPRLELRANPDDPSMTQVTLDGQVISELSSDAAPGLGDIVLMGSSDAAYLAAA